MRGFFILIPLFLQVSLSVCGQSDEKDFAALQNELVAYSSSGHFVKAEQILLSYIDSHKNLSADKLYYINSFSGIINSSLGRYDAALGFYEKSIQNLSEFPGRYAQYAYVYLMMGSIYLDKNLYPQALEYYEKSKRSSMQIRDDTKYLYLALADNGLGIVHNLQRNYYLALEYLNESLSLKQRYKLPESGSVLMTIARVKENLGKNKEAADYYVKGINASIREFGNKFYRLGEILFSYGRFLQKTGRNDESLAVFRKSLNINLGVYGKKHALTSFSYKNLGDFYLNTHNYDSAIYYYQQSLISVVSDYENTDIYSNPDPDNNKVIYYNRLLENLKSKATAFERKSYDQDIKENKIKYLNSSLESIETALRIVDILRSNYFSEENRLYLAGNQKDAYLSAARILYSLYTLTGNESLKNKLFSVSQQAKAATLSNELTGNSLLESKEIPDSLRTRLKNLLSEIQEYDKLIQNELSAAKPDSLKLNALQDSRFNANREKGSIDRKVSALIPQYFEMLRRIEPSHYTAIQQRLDRNETVLDYLMSPGFIDGRRKLYFFVLNRNSLTIRESEVDSSFTFNSDVIRRTSDPELSENKTEEGFFRYSSSLYYMYSTLIRPVEDLIQGKNLIIIPDEELESLPFETFLRKPPEKGQSDFEGLDFLINDYTFSYSYSTSFINGRLKKYLVKPALYTFSPAYTAMRDTEPGFLEGAMRETKAINSLFEGNTFTGGNVSKDLFLQSTGDSAILHLALHTMTDTVNSKFSYMLFNKGKDDDGKLFNYEISLARVKSPMVVLSSCNSGTGTLRSGAGLMSIARSFFLAGASSVVKTSWEVNDDSGSEIIKKFYYYLSEGKSKDDALRMAKLDFIKRSAPAFSNPYYWAAYSILGDAGPVRKNNKSTVLIIAVILIISAGGVIYFKRRRIS